MTAKKTVDGIRRDYALPLGLSRSRDVVARLLFDRPYSAAMAAERAGKLSPPGLVESRTQALAQQHGPWVLDLAKVADRHLLSLVGPFAALPLGTLLAIAELSAQRDGDGFVFEELDAVSAEPPAWVDALSEQLQQRLAQLDDESAVELEALVRLGRGNGNYARLLDQARSTIGSGDLGTWLSAMPIHRYVAKGLVKLGDAGLQVIEHYPQIGQWVADPVPAEPVVPELSLRTIADLERELETLVGRARLPEPFEAYARRTCHELDRLQDLDYFGSDEQMPYLTVGYAERQYAVLCICGDLQIGKAYYYAGDVEAAVKRITHARTFIADLARTIQKGPRMAQYAASGGRGKARKLDPLKREFMRLIEAERPDGGWRSMDRTAAALLEPMRAANDALTPRPLLSASLDSTLRAWLSKDAAIREVYFRNRFAKVPAKTHDEAIRAQAAAFSGAAASASPQACTDRVRPRRSTGCSC